MSDTAHNASSAERTSTKEGQAQPSLCWLGATAQRVSNRGSDVADVQTAPFTRDSEVKRGQGGMDPCLGASARAEEEEKRSADEGGAKSICVSIRAS